MRGNGSDREALKKRIMQCYLRSLRLPLLTFIQLHLPPCLPLRCPHLVFLPISISSLSLTFTIFLFLQWIYIVSIIIRVKHRPESQEKTNFFFGNLYIFMRRNRCGWVLKKIIILPLMMCHAWHSCYMKSVHACMIRSEGHSLKKMVRLPEVIISTVKY